MNELSFDRVPGSELQAPAAPYKNGGSHASQSLSIPVITQYLRIAYRWKWLILGSIAMALLIALVFTLLSTKQYTATSRIEINRESGRIVNVADVEPQTSAFDNEFYQTQYGLLKSRSLAQRVATKLRLADNRGFFEMFGAGETFDRIAAENGGNQAAAREARLRAAIDILLARVEIAPMRMSRIVDIQFTSPDRNFSVQIANEWAIGFIQSNLERRLDATSYARQFLEERLGQLRARLERSERELVAYASNESIINIPVNGPDGARGTQERSLTADSLAAMNLQMSQATGDRIRAQSRLRGDGGASPEALANTAIATLRQRRAEAAAERARLLTQYEPAYPPIQALDSQIAQLDRSISREESRVSSTIGSTYNEAVTRENTIRAQMDSLRAQFLDQRRRSIQYNIFARDVDTNRQLYEGLLQRYKEIGVAGVGTNNVSIVDRAEAPERPSKPRPLINLMLALIAGLALGGGLALVREQMDETVVDPSEVEKKVGFPLLGVIPKTAIDDPYTEVADPKSNLFEAYLAVQTNLSFSTDHGVPRVLALTSTRAAEGKSLSAYAISTLLARDSASVILVDADMRSPSVHHQAGVANDKGLSNYLSGISDLDLLIQTKTDSPFPVLTAGPLPPNAAELLRGDRFATLVAELSKRYRHVIIDSPPVLGLADAPIIASQAEAVVFVIEARGISGRVARLALARLQQARGHILGTILTKFESKRAHFGYGYEYGYGYGQRGDSVD